MVVDSFHQNKNQTNHQRNLLFDDDDDDGDDSDDDDDDNDDAECHKGGAKKE